MAAGTPTAFGGQNHEFTLPIPPPLIHTRSGNDINEQPGTPRRDNDAFISPVQTPTGSPSKNRMPPGAFDLPDVFSNAMKLVPTQGQPNGKALQTKQQGSTSPNKADQDPFAGLDTKGGAPGSPLRKQGKENTPPSHRPQMQQTQSFINQAAASRQEPYRTRGDAVSYTHLTLPTKRIV